MGLPKDLHFKNGDFSNVASAYAFAHLAMQAPNGRTDHVRFITAY
jgi:hypothetical protein